MTLMGFSERLKEAMDDADISQKNLANRVGVTRTTMNLYCNYGSVPNAVVFAKICAQLKVSSDWLLGISKDRWLNG